MIIEKDILAPGAFLTANGVAVFSPARVVRIYQAGKALLRDGFHSQIPYEHHDDSEPIKLSADGMTALLTQEEKAANKLKHNTGFVKDWMLKTTPDGQPWLWAKLDIQDEEAADKIGKTILFCSPQINNKWTSGKGNEYLDAPIHVALTNVPVIQDQQPFKPQATPAGTFRLSCAVPIAPTTPRRKVGIIKVKQSPAKKSVGEPAMRNLRKLMFSLAPDDLGGGGGTPAGTPDAPNEPDITSIAASLSVLSGDQFKACLDSLSPEKQQEFKMAIASAEPEPEPMPEPNPNGTALSLEKLIKNNDPRDVRIAKLEGERLCGQVDGLLLSGRITPVKAAALKAKITNEKTRLSLCLENHGDLNSVIQEIEIRQTLKEGSECPIDKTKLSLPPRPNHAKVPPDEAEIKKDQEKIGEEMANMAR